MNTSSFCTFCGNRVPEEGNIVGRLIVLGEHQLEYLIGDVERSMGRDPGNDLVVDDDEMSAHHARISFREQSFWVEDLESRNGTFVNGSRIGESTRLRNEDLLRMGHTLMKFQI